MGILTTNIMTKIEVYVDGKLKLEKEIKFVEPSEIVRTFEMVLDYATLHKGSKIKMLKGLQGLR